MSQSKNIVFQNKVIEKVYIFTIVLVKIKFLFVYCLKILLKSMLEMYICKILVDIFTYKIKYSLFFINLSLKYRCFECEKCAND